MRRLIPFVRPVYRGARFDDHVLPVDLVVDLQVYQALVAELAAALYRKDHPDRQRLPKGFTEAFSLGISGVRDGSAVALVERVVDDTMLFPSDDDYFSRARDLVDQTLRAANDDAEIPSDFPYELLTRFNALGRALRDDEHVVWNLGTREDGPRYDRQIRKRLVLRRAQSYEQEVHLDGFVSGHDWPQGSPTGKLIVTLNGSNVPVHFGPELADNVRRVLGSSEPFVRLSATGVYDRNDKLQRVIDTHTLDLIEPSNTNRDESLARLTAHIEKIAALREGWLNGDGAEFSTLLLAAVRDSLMALFNRGFAMPYVWPTGDGDVRAEWVPAVPFDVSASFDPSGRRVYLHSTPGIADEFDELEVDRENLDTIERFLTAHGISTETLA